MCSHWWRCRSSHSCRAPAPASKRWLPKSRLLLRSAEQVDLKNNTVRLPLHRGVANGKTVWFIISEASDFGLAADLNVNFSNKLSNLAIGCAACVQQTTISSDPGLPWAPDEASVGRWGVETEHANVLLCGAGARRGGGVSGIPGHNAAKALLTR